jgi:hypothetical protein
MYGYMENQEIQLKQINEVAQQLKSSFDAISQSRSNYQIENFVVRDHASQERQFVQCVLEMRVKTSNIKRTLIQKERLNRKLKSIEDDLEIAEINLSLEDLEYSLLSDIREWYALYSIYQALPKFSYEQIQNAECAYWQHRLARQAQIDIECSGRIGIGNMDALRQAGMMPDFGSTFLRSNEQLIQKNLEVHELSNVLTNKSGT